MRQRLVFAMLKQMLVIAMIPLILLGGAAVLILLPKMNAQRVVSFNTIALSVSEQIDTYLEAAKEQLTIVAQDFVDDPRSQQLVKRLNSVVQTSNMFGTLYTTFPNGRIQTIGLPLAQIGTQKLYIGMKSDFNSEQIQTLKQGQYYWSGVYVSPITGRHTIRLHVRLGDYLLAGEVDIEHLPTLAAQLSQNGYLVMLLDARGNLIAHPDPDISRQQLSMRFAPLFTKNTDNIRQGSFDWQGQSYQASVIPMPKYGWQVVVAQPVAQFTATERNMGTLWMILTAASLLITIGVAYLTARLESRVFQQVTERSHRIASGDYQVAPIKTRIEEYHNMVDAIISLAQGVREREEQLKQLNTQLEDRVNDRTAELSTTNDELNASLQHLKNTQKQLIQSEKLASLGSLVAGIAHELNTPIGNAKIALSSQLDYQRDIRKAITEQALTRSQLDQFLADMADTSDIAYRNMDNASLLIRSFKHVAVDQSSSKLRNFNLAILVDEVLVTMQPTLKKQPVRITVAVPTTIDMRSIPGAVSQILTNLINNAIFHGMDGHRELHIEISAEQKGQRVLLDFSDNGVGMSMETVKRAFDPFFTTKFGQGGSGLGLNIVHRLTVELLRGSVRLASNEGDGTHFYLTLPADISQSLDDTADS